MRASWIGSGNRDGRLEHQSCRWLQGRMNHCRPVQMKSGAARKRATPEVLAWFSVGLLAANVEVPGSHVSIEGEFHQRHYPV
jgi:hypothetical protein